MAQTKAKFKFRICYFTPRGFLHKETFVEWETRLDVEGPLMRDALAKLRGLRDCGGQMGMPGDVDEGWDGPILIESEGSDPCLLMPST